MTRPKKIVDPCHHWTVTLDLRACADCDYAFIVTPDAKAAAQTERDEHNARVIGNMTQDTLPGMTGEGDAQ